MGDTMALAAAIIITVSQYDGYKPWELTNLIPPSFKILIDERDTNRSIEPENGGDGRAIDTAQVDATFVNNEGANISNSRFEIHIHQPSIEPETHDSDCED